jgi:Na+/H+-dicarboxylate symporter
MNESTGGFLKNYASIIRLLIGIILGTFLGLFLGKKVEIIKPIGDIFLNLLFTAVIPLIFSQYHLPLQILTAQKKWVRL